MIKSPFEIHYGQAKVPPEPLLHDQTVEFMESAFLSGVAAAAKTMGATRSICSKCRADMWRFTHSGTGKPGVLSAQGCSHFADCPHAADFRKGKP